MSYFYSMRKRLQYWYSKKTLSLPIKLLMAPYCFICEYFERHASFWPITIEKVNLVLTTRCTLHCAKCCNLMAYYKKPADFEYSDVLQDIKYFLKIVKGIRCLQLIGGEPLMFKQLPELLNYLNGEKKIKQILIVTNGTIIPSPELLAALKHRKVNVIISNYIRLNTKINDVYFACLNSGINVRLEGLVWRDMEFGTRKDRTCEEHDRIYTECYRECHELFNGEYHLCSRSSNATCLGMLMPNAGDFVDIRHENNRRKIKKSKTMLRQLLYRKNHIVACEYCMGNRLENKIIVDAEQIPADKYLDFNGNIVSK